MAELIENMSDKDYFALDAVNASTLKAMKNPELYMYRKDHPMKSDALTFGTHFHDFVLRGIFPDLCVSPFADFRSKAAKEWKATQLEAGKSIIKEKDYDDYLAQIEGMTAAVHGLDGFSDFLETSKNEVVILWETEGVPCKAKIDAFNENDNYVYDLKTCASLETFDRDAIKYGYHISAAWYREAVRQLTGESKGFRFAVAGKDQPYQSRMVECSEVLLDCGDAMCEKYLDVYIGCKEYGQWPSPYDTGSVLLDAPEWLVRDSGLADLVL